MMGDARKPSEPYNLTNPLRKAYQIKIYSNYSRIKVRYLGGAHSNGSYYLASTMGLHVLKLPQ